MRFNTNKYFYILIVAANLLFLNNVYAVNWLMLQGVTNEPYPLVWGFLQPSYIQTSGSALSMGPWQDQQALRQTVAIRIRARRIA